MNKDLYLCHLLVLSSPTLLMHGHMNLNLNKCLQYWADSVIGMENVDVELHHQPHVKLRSESQKQILRQAVICLKLLSLKTRIQAEYKKKILTLSPCIMRGKTRSDCDIFRLYDSRLFGHDKDTEVLISP